MVLVVILLTTMLASVAALVMRTGFSSSTATSGRLGKTGPGGGGAGNATTVKLLVALRCCALTAQGLKSVATVANRFVLGNCPAPGTQVMMPFESIAAFAGAPNN